MWKIAALLFILRLSSRGGKSSIKRLHLLNWANRSPANRDSFLRSRKDPLPLFRFNVRFEPAFSRAIDLAEGLGLVQWAGGDKIQISAKGQHLADQFLGDQEPLHDERVFLVTIGKAITESEANQILGLAKRQ